MTTLCPDQFYVSVLTNCELPVGRKSGFRLYHVKPRASAHIRFFTNVGPVSECTTATCPGKRDGTALGTQE